MMISSDKHKISISKEELKKILLRAIQLSNSNKITTENSWDIDLIPHLERAIENQTFQQNSITIDTATKIYTKRVDSVHNEAIKILALFAERKKKKEKKDSGDQQEEDSEKKKKKRKLCVNTLASSDDAIRRDERTFQDRLYDPFRSGGVMIQYELGDPQSLLTNKLIFNERGSYVLDFDQEVYPSFRNQREQLFQMLRHRDMSRGDDDSTTSPSAATKEREMSGSPTLQQVQQLLHTPPRNPEGDYDTLNIDKRHIPNSLPPPTNHRLPPISERKVTEEFEEVPFVGGGGDDVDDDGIGGGGDAMGDGGDEIEVPSLYQLDPSEFHQGEDDDDEDDYQEPGDVRKMLFHEESGEERKDLDPIANSDNIVVDDDYSYFNEKISVIRDHVQSTRKKVVYDWTGLNRFKVTRSTKKRNLKRRKMIDERRKKKNRVDFTLAIKKNDFENLDGRKPKKKKKKALVHGTKQPIFGEIYLLPKDHNYALENLLRPFTFRPKIRRVRRRLAGADELDHQRGILGRDDDDMDGGDEIGGGGDVMDDGAFPPVPDLGDGPGDPLLPSQAWLDESENMGEPMMKKRRLTIQKYLNPDSLLESHSREANTFEETIDRIQKDVLLNSRFAFNQRSYGEGANIKPKRLYRVSNRQRVDVKVLKDVMWKVIEVLDEDGEQVEFCKVLKGVRSKKRTQEATISESFVSILHLANEKGFRVKERAFTRRLEESDFTVELPDEKE